jgi:F-type H+-transporting ATPase subunit b
MRLSLAFAGLLAAMPAAAFADGGMPQMDFHNPLTVDQIVWMVVILVALYVALAGWGLPQIGAVLETRAGIIRRDLDAAQAAKAAADAAVKALDQTLQNARARAQSEIADAVAAAKAQAKAQADAATARLDAQLADSEAQIALARQTAMEAVKPVAMDAAAAILSRLTGTAPSPAALTHEIDTVLALRDAA